MAIGQKAYYKSAGDFQNTLASTARLRKEKARFKKKYSPIGKTVKRTLGTYYRAKDSKG